VSPVAWEGGSRVHLHQAVTGCIPPDPAKVNAPCWQGIPLMVTLVEFPGESSPLAGVKLAPLKPLSANHFTVS